MMRVKMTAKGWTVGVIAGVFLVTGIGAGSWYYCVDALSFSEIVGDSLGPRGTALTNLFDFDTGLSRYDLHNLKNKNAYWEKRMQEVSAVQNPVEQQEEYDKLVAEMMQDPTMKKVMQKVVGFGSQAAMSLVRAIGGS